MADICDAIANARIDEECQCIPESKAQSGVLLGRDRECTQCAHDGGREKDSRVSSDLFASAILERFEPDSACKISMLEYWQCKR